MGRQKAKRDATTRDAQQPGASRRSGRRPRALWIVAVAAVAVAATWVLRSSPSTFSSTQTPSAATVQSLRADVIRRLDHDRGAFTQGLLWHDGRLYESTGQYGASTLRRIDPATGDVEKQIELAPEYFGEGLALASNRLLWLTWKESTAFVYDVESFAQVERFQYTGEGWGLTHDGRRLIMSDGTSELTFRDPRTFEDLGSLRVTLRGRPQDRLNELEWADGAIYANVWERDFIVRVDPESGRVTHLIDVAGLLTAAEAATVDVLNGIAHNPETKTFYITGKWWPAMFEVRFVP